MEDSPIGLDKWLPAIWMIVNAKNGISSYEIHRHLGVTQKSAWFMLHRIRLAMQSKTWSKLSGHVEADETFIGGKARFMHKHKREQKIKGTGPLGKVAVMGLLERHGEVRVSVVENRKKKTLQAEIKQHIEPGSELFTDDLKSYYGLDAHTAKDRPAEKGGRNVHTNGSKLWSLPKHPQRHVFSVEHFTFSVFGEQAFRSTGARETILSFLKLRKLSLSPPHFEQLRANVPPQPGGTGRQRRGNVTIRFRRASRAT